MLWRELIEELTLIAVRCYDVPGRCALDPLILAIRSYRGHNPSNPVSPNAVNVNAMITSTACTAQ
jgi:hypothetical protein